MRILQSNRDSVLLYAALIIGLSFVSIYADLAGHGSAFSSCNDLIENRTGFNARFFFSLGLMTFGLLAAKFYDKVLGIQRLITILTCILSIVALSFYAIEMTWITDTPSFIIVIGVFLIGLTYGWFEAYLLMLLFYIDGYKNIIRTLIFSFVLKCITTRIIGSMDNSIQEITLFLSPIVILCSCAAVWRTANFRQTNTPPYSLFAEKAPLKKRFIFIVLFCLSVFQSIARGLSTLGFWGNSNTIDNNNLLEFIIILSLLMVVAYFVFIRLSNCRIEFMLGVGFLILMGGLVTVEIIKSMGIFDSSTWSRSFSEFVELFAHMFWLVFIISVVRMTQESPIRVIGLAEVVLSLTAAMLSYPLASLSGFARSVVLVSVYALAVLMMCIFYLSMRTKNQTSSNVFASSLQFEEIASRSGLSQRECEVFMLLAQGRTRKVIQEELYISESTVKTHIQNIYQKLGIHSKQELISLARKTLE